MQEGTCMLFIYWGWGRVGGAFIPPPQFMELIGLSYLNMGSPPPFEDWH